MYKACIFDLDGTLTDTLESLSYSVNATLKEMGLKQITDEMCKSFVGNGARRLLEQSIQAAGDTDASRIDEAMDIYGRIFKQYCTYHVAPYDGVTELLGVLKEMGVHMAVLSNKPHLQTKDVVSTFFSEEIFEQVYGQREGVPRKPDPAAVHELLQELGVKPEECIYIGDSEVDMATGCAAKVTTVGVTWGFRTKDSLIQSGANYTVDKPQELLAIVKGEN